MTAPSELTPLGDALAGTAPLRVVPQMVTPPGMLPLDEVDARHASQGDQFRHDNTLSPLAPRPGEAVTVWATSGSGLPLARAIVFYTTDGTAPGAHGASVAMAVHGVDWDERAGYVTRWRAVLPPQAAGTTVRYRLGGWREAGAHSPGAEPDLWAHDGQGFWFHYPGQSGLTTFAYAVEPEGQDAPAWAADAVIYQIFLDRFHPGTPGGVFAGSSEARARHGGTLRGVQQALPYLQELGVTCLWLSPLCQAETYHRYDTTDLYRVDPDLGTEQHLRDLVDEAHRRGLRILLDFVPSHCSWHHPAFQAAQDDPAAATREWFIFERWPDVYRNFLGAVPALPSINTEYAGARAHVIGSAVHWLRDCGVDGFRLDHAIAPGMDFWVAFRAATRQARADVFNLGEVTDTPDCLRRYRSRLDGVLDFLLTRALSQTFASGEWGVAALDGFLAAHERYMAPGPARVSFLDNHDMQRFLFLAGGDARRLKLAALCQFSLVATPAIYYGTEIGLTQQVDFALGGDAEARRDMPWDRRAWDHDLLAFYRTLIRLRLAHRALRAGARRTIHLDDVSGTYAYARSSPDAPEQQLIAVFNLSQHERTIMLPPDLAAGAVNCLLSTGETAHLQASPAGPAITLAPLTGALLRAGT